MDDEARLARAAAALGVGLFAWEPLSDRITWSEAALALWGFPAGQHPADRAGLLAAVHGRDRSRLAAALAAAETAGAPFELELGIGSGAAALRRLGLRGSGGRGASGVVGMAAHAAPDRRDGPAEPAPEGEFRLLLETVPDPLIVMDDDGIVRAFSRAAERCFGYRAQDVIGQNVAMLMPPPDRDRHDAYLDRYLQTGERRMIGLGRAVSARRADGRVFPARLTLGEAHRPDGRRLFAGVVQDLSERRAAEAHTEELRAELLHVSRLADMGQLSATLAHELNQPLTAAAAAVRAAARMLAQQGDAPSAVHEAVGLAAEQVLRAGQIVRRLRSFVDKGRTERRPEDLARVIEDALALASLGAAERGIEVTTAIAPDLPAVLIDRIQVQQVLVNLVRNAIDAMAATGGRLAVRASPGAMVEIAIEDSGPGLDQAVAARLFEPFVTTKPDGMGVGLSICRGIVEAHGGSISAEPRPGGGTIFRFSVPPVPAPPPP